MLRWVLTQVLASSDEGDTISTWINVFRPVLIVVNFFGIPLPMKNNGVPTPLSVWFVDIYGWILYCINVASGLPLTRSSKPLPQSVGKIWCAFYIVWSESINCRPFLLFSISLPRYFNKIRFFISLKCRVRLCSMNLFNTYDASM